MMEQDTLILTAYIAAWAWQIIAMIYLVSSFLALLLGNNIVAAVFVIMTGVCEFLSLRRQKEVYNES